MWGGFWTAVEGRCCLCSWLYNAGKWEARGR